MAGNDPQRQVGKLVRHIERQGYAVVREEPDSVKRVNSPRLVRVTMGDGYPAGRTALGNPVARAVIASLSAAGLGEPVISPTMGGSGPAYVFTDILRAPFVALPTVNHDNNQHAENEDVRLGNLFQLNSEGFHAPPTGTLTWHSSDDGPQLGIGTNPQAARPLVAHARSVTLSEPFQRAPLAQQCGRVEHNCTNRRVVFVQAAVPTQCSLVVADLFRRLSDEIAFEVMCVAGTAAVSADRETREPGTRSDQVAGVHCQTCLKNSGQFAAQCVGYRVSHWFAQTLKMF